MAGVSRLQYSTETRLIRVMCSGRVDLAFVIRAFSNGMDGVFIGGCRLNECNYITHGNYDALGMVYMCKRIMKYMGIHPDRLHIEFMSSGEGNIFIGVMNEFGKKVRELGPLGASEGVDERELRLKLEAVMNLIPYIKLVERERLRVPVKTEKAYRDFFGSEELDRLFNELVLDKLAVSQILLLLHKKPLSTGEIAERLSLSASEVSRHMNTSSMQGFVRYDESEKRFALA